MCVQRVLEKFDTLKKQKSFINSLRWYKKIVTKNLDYAICNGFDLNKQNSL